MRLARLVSLSLLSAEFNDVSNSTPPSVNSHFKLFVAGPDWLPEGASGTMLEKRLNVVRAPYGQSRPVS